MIVEIINVGTELLLGEIVNTNATYLQKMCKELGFNVYHQSVVGDNPDRLLECFDIAFKRGADCIITTGGLGPTTDDLTKELSAQYLGLEMVYNEKEAKKVYDKCSFVTGLDEIPQNNFKQAYFPIDCYILENEVGTANGCVMSKDNKMIINLPGPPKEMTYVVNYSLIPYLQQYKEDKIYTYEYLTMFIGESKLQEVLNDLIENQNNVSIALYAGEETVRVRLAVKTFSQEEADRLMKNVKVEIEKRIGTYIIKENNLKEALMKIMIPYHLYYNGSFRLKDNFLDGKFYDENSKFFIKIYTKKEKLGERLLINIDDNEVMNIPLLKKAEYSYAKAEARIIAGIYKYLRNRQV